MAFGIPNIERVVSNFLESGKGITQIRSVEWEKKFLWIVDFVDFKPPAPFNEFFPANDITIPFGVLESHQIDLAQDVVNVPLRVVSGEITMTFYDDENRTLLKWFSDWMNLDIANNGKFVSGLADEHQSVSADSFGEVRKVRPVRQMRFAGLDAGRDETLVHNVWVYPDGEISFNGAQVSDAQTYTISFKVVKDSIKENALREKPKQQDLLSTESLKSLVGRFI